VLQTLARIDSRFSTIRHKASPYWPIEQILCCKVNASKKKISPGNDEREERAMSTANGIIKVFAGKNTSANLIFP